MAPQSLWQCPPIAFYMRFATLSPQNPQEGHKVGAVVVDPGKDMRGVWEPLLPTSYPESVWLSQAGGKKRIKSLFGRESIQ